MTRLALPLAALLVSGCSYGSGDVAPEIRGFALYVDANDNGILDAGDELILTFSQAITIGSPVAADFDLPVTGNSLGGSPTFAVGPTPEQLTIVLGTSPSFAVRQFFCSESTDPGDPSGIDVMATITPGSIVGTDDETALPSFSADIAPTFSDTGQVFGALATRAVVQGDFDGDSDLDLFLVNDGVGNRVLLNDGAGVFTDTAQSLGSAPSQGAAVADFDGDGDLDVAVANESGQTNRIWENDGAGTFTAGSPFGTGQSLGVAAGDLDGDGDIDLAVANRGGNTVWRNDGSGSFISTGQTLAIATSRAVAMADLDLDGDLDLAFANDGSVGKVWRNNGMASFSVIADLIGPNQGTAIAIADLTLDGFPDIVVGSLDRGAVPFINFGIAGFLPDPQLGTGSVRAIALADFDADGDPDLVEGRSGGLPDRVWFNDGIGFFDDSGMVLLARSTYGAVLGDHDSDGDLDLFTASLNQSSASYRNSLSAAPGGFDLVDSGQDLRNNTNPAFNITLDAALVDFDLDGQLDYLNGAAPNGGARKWSNDGTGVFILGAQFGTPGVSADAVAAADLDGDSDPDLLIGRSGTSTLVFRNDGGGMFTAIGTIATSISATRLRLGDLDGDGDRDLVSDAGSVTRVFLNNGSGVFTDTGQSIGSFPAAGIALGDLDGDGDRDLVIGRSGAGNRVYTNNGSAIFTDSAQSLGTGTTRDVELADLEGDGDLDLVEARDGGNRVWTNDGTGVFTDTLQSLGIDDTVRIALADLDLDGDLDLLEANAGDDSRVRLNDGTGVFIDSGLVLVTNGGARAVVAGDIDLDGDLDVIFGTTTGDRVYFRD